MEAIRVKAAARTPPTISCFQYILIIRKPSDPPWGMIKLAADPNIAQNKNLLAEKAKALDAFLSTLSAKGLDLSTVHSIRTLSGEDQEAEVIERVRQQWRAAEVVRRGTSRKWASLSLAKRYRLFEAKLAAVKAYREIDEVLQRHHLRLTGVAVEDLHCSYEADPNDLKKTVLVPFIWSAWIGVWPE